MTLFDNLFWRGGGSHHATPEEAFLRKIKRSRAREKRRRKARSRQRKG